MGANYLDVKINTCLPCLADGEKKPGMAGLLECCKAASYAAWTDA
ncbi:MAG: hypothetical protein RSE46_21965 [Janthinobacterium sp.]